MTLPVRDYHSSYIHTFHNVSFSLSMLVENNSEQSRTVETTVQPVLRHIDRNYT